MGNSPVISFRFGTGLLAFVLRFSVSPFFLLSSTDLGPHVSRSLARVDELPYLRHMDYQIPYVKRVQVDARFFPTGYTKLPLLAGTMNYPILKTLIKQIAGIGENKPSRQPVV